METHLLDGRKIAHEIYAEIKDKIQSLKGEKPGLAFILVGNNPASRIYVEAKKKACKATGILSTLIELPESIPQDLLLKEIEALNHAPSIDGILVQLPLPSHIDPKAIMFAIDPAKDVDGFHPLNMGKLLLGEEGGFIPCTPRGILTLLHRSSIPVQGKHVVIVGRSNIVGKPLAALLMQKHPKCNATVTIAHSHSNALPEITHSADILIAAIGQPHFIQKHHVRQGTVVIDVGINRLTDNTLRGDVDFLHVAPLTSAITPVPGGVGPMTIAMLLENTLLSFSRKIC